MVGEGAREKGRYLTVVLVLRRWVRTGRWALGHWTRARESDFGCPCERMADGGWRPVVAVLLGWRPRESRPGRPACRA